MNMLRRPLALLFALALPAAVTVGCGSDDNESAEESTTTTTEAAVSLDGTAWTLTSYTADGTSTEAAGGNPAVLQFRTDGSLNGNTGCNTFGGTWESAKPGELTIGSGPMTQMACADPAVDAQEQAIVAALPEVARYSATTSELKLLDADGGELLAYGVADTEIAGSSWKVTGVNNGNDAVESSALTEALTLAFAEDGTLSGTAGCNNITGGWEVDGDSITIQAGSTMMACEEDVMALEQQYLAALEASTTYEISGDSLTLRDDAGAMQVTLTRG